MRNLHTSIPVGLATDNHSVETEIKLRENSHTPVSLDKSSYSPPKNRNGFSQVTRNSVMQKNVLDASSFMDQQQRVLKQLIKQLQIFIGYREQLPKSQHESINEHSWSVYLMHAQSLQSALKSRYMGKDLFGNGIHSPIRFHLLKGDTVVPFDLPDPCLVSMISIRAFLGGISGHQLPSVKLGNACIAELLNALVEVQHGKERLQEFTHSIKKFAKKKTIRITQSEGSYSFVAKTNSWSEKLLAGLNSVLRFAQPAST